MAGRPADAAALLACADAVRDESSFNEVWVAKMNSDTWGRIRQELDADAVTAAAERGRGMALDDVVDLALDLLDDLVRAGSCGSAPTARPSRSSKICLRSRPLP